MTNQPGQESSQDIRNDDAKVMLGTMPMREGEILRDRLAGVGVTVALAVNHASCTTGCAPSYEVWVHPEDMPEVRSFMLADRAAKLADLGVDPAALDAVFDPSQAEATCPACGTVFPTTSSECPECGLGFGA